MAKQWVILPANIIGIVGNIEAALVFKALVDAENDAPVHSKYITIGLDKLAESALLMVDGVYYGLESIIKYMDYLAAQGLISYKSSGNELRFTTVIDEIEETS